MHSLRSLKLASSCTLDIQSTHWGQRRMDQSAFRNLLHKPQSAASGSSPSQARKLGSAPKRGVISGHSKPPQNVSSYAKETKEKADRAAAAELKPRIRSKDPMKGRYKDRAEARRLGIENEFGEVEKLQEEFEDGGGDEEKRAFLGGDAKHSVLVKGLDRALLAQRKAELQLEQNADLDTELEALASSDLKPAATEEATVTEVPKKGGAKTKAEILAELKATQAASLGSKFKSIAAPEKKKKKKKKKVEAGPTTIEEPKVEIIAPVVVERLPTPPPVVKAKPKPPKFAIQIDDDGDDIFADVEEYQLGVPSDDDDDEEGEEVGDVPEVLKREASLPMEDMEMDEEDEDEERQPLKRSRSRSRTRSPPTKRTRFSKSPSPVTFDPFTHVLSASEDEEESDTDMGGRLVPLDSSALPSVREFLALDTEAAKADAKKAKKAKWKAQQGGEGGEKQEMNEKQKLNREHQLLQNHLAAKKV